MPLLRHVATCLTCGWREPTRLESSYATRCPNDGRRLEHSVVAFDDRTELRRVRREGDRRVVTR